EPAGREHGERQKQLRPEHCQGHAAMDTWGQMVRVPGGPRRKRLSLKMEVERGEAPPRGVAAQELRKPREEHELEEQEPEQPAYHRRRLGSVEPERRQPAGRRPETGGEAPLQQGRGPPAGREKPPPPRPGR